ncbi:MAG: hypothetical protein MUF01_07260 [Bryobacterales bacterium]|nr:hypothetical protein [Bryobacterales bacterium]
MPVSILREQASALKNKTKGLVTAEVLSRSGSSSVYGSDLDDGELEHHFVICAPTLDGYRYDLFSVRHDDLSYPATGHFNAVTEEIPDEAHFESWLRGVFRHERTKRIIHSLIAQVSEPIAS